VAKKKKPDYLLLIISGLIFLLGFLVFASVSVVFSQRDFQTPYYYLSRQILTGFLPGLALAFLFYKAPLEKIKKIAPGLLIFSLFLMALIFIPQISLMVRGASRWISIAGISFQPSEILKLTYIIYLAALFSNREKSKKNDSFIAFLVVSIIIGIFLIAQPDLSTLIVILLTAFVMFFALPSPMWHNLTIGVLGCSGLIVLIATSPYRLERIKPLLPFLEGELDPGGMSYQARQALFAIGSGGLAGLGIGMSSQKHGFMPIAMSDSIFALFAEETGFIGSIILILLFLAFFWRGFLIAMRNPHQFSKFLALGISFWIFFQAFVNIGAMTGLLPITGIPLPFISYGRTHLIVEMAALGLLLNASKS